VLAGYGLTAAMGRLDPVALSAIQSASWLGLPPFRTPVWSWQAIGAISPVFIVLVAENKGHIAAISSCLKRDLTPHLGRAYMGDALATFVSAMGGGTPQTTYAENMGVMAITKVFSVYNFVMAACIALILGVSPKFGAVIQSIPAPVLGGVTVVLYGLIAIMGVKIWVDAQVDFAEHKNLIVAGSSVIVATGLGLKGLGIGGLNISGITVGTLMALALNGLLSWREPQP
jgi:xanthine/uracil permease